MVDGRFRSASDEKAVPHHSCLETSPHFSTCRLLPGTHIVAGAAQLFLHILNLLRLCSLLLHQHGSEEEVQQHDAQSARYVPLNLQAFKESPQTIDCCTSSGLFHHVRPKSTSTVRLQHRDPPSKQVPNQLVENQSYTSQPGETPSSVPQQKGAEERRLRAAATRPESDQGEVEVYQVWKCVSRTLMSEREDFG